MVPHTPLANSFPQFSRLPPELRLKIWEDSWPEAQVIEATCGDGFELSELDETSPEVTSLRPMCCLTTWVKYVNQGSYREFEEEEPLEECTQPVALRVCRESRVHTLRRFVKMQHATITSSIFYINPHADVLWITEDASDDPRKLLDLKRHYGTQLRQISRLVIEDGSWDTRDHLHEFYDLLSDLMYLYIILDEDSLAVNQPTRAPSTAAQRKLAVKALRARDAERLRGKGWDVRYIDGMERQYLV